MFELLIVAAILYLVPTLVAAGRSHQQTGAIFVLNLLLGWTFLGWVGALVWACTSKSAEPQIIVVGEGQDPKQIEAILRKKAAPEMADERMMRRW